MEAGRGGEGEGGNSNYDLEKAGHPVACIATFIFKALGIFFYLIVGSILSSNIITFIFVILFSSLDFWVVKNVTGRLLVGLRWWSEIDKDGNEQWRFENPNEGRVVNAVDNFFFWVSQAAGTVVWGLLLVLKVLTLSIFWVSALLCRVSSSSCAPRSAPPTCMRTTSVVGTTRRSWATSRSADSSDSWARWATPSDDHRFPTWIR